MSDNSFMPHREGLTRAVGLLEYPPEKALASLPRQWPEEGLGEETVLESLAPAVLSGAEDLGSTTAFAHMDPPTPWISWAMAMWAASKNQNLLHPATSPIASEVEARVIDWIAPFFGMNGGHMTSGSTIANLTAIWAARETAGVKRVLASAQAHVSVRKAANILGLEYGSVPCDTHGCLDTGQLPDDLSQVCLVLTAGTTNTGAIDPMTAGTGASWRHVDAAWAGPLRFSKKHAGVLDKIESADSVAISGHKWLYQPKDSGVILFKDVETAHASISYGGAYLTTPNVGVQGSRGANALPLLATLLALGRDGLVDRIERGMSDMRAFAAAIEQTGHAELFAPPSSGVLAWRPHRVDAIDDVFRAMPTGSVSTTRINDAPWLRNVAANPNVEIDRLIDAARSAIMTNL